MKIIVLILITGITLPSIAQKTERSSVWNCPPHANHAKFSVEFFLLAEQHSNLRSESGTMNESVDQIEIVDSSTDCIKLMNFINNIVKYREINDNISSEETIYFYQTEKFYYVSWGKKPEFFIPYMGPKELFLVIKKDLSDLWEFYL